jgi:UDP-N-acetylmuramate dehydrogenase
MPDLSKYGTAGSYFKNVIVNRKEAEYFLNEYKDAKFWELPNGNVKISSAWVLDHVLNIRGIRVGNVGTAENQALVIVNFGGGSSFEVKNFAEEIKKKFFEKTKLNLEEEICYVGF